MHEAGKNFDAHALQSRKYEMKVFRVQNKPHQYSVCVILSTTQKSVKTPREAYRGACTHTSLKSCIIQMVDYLLVMQLVRRAENTALVGKNIHDVVQYAKKQRGGWECFWYTHCAYPFIVEKDVDAAWSPLG